MRDRNQVFLPLNLEICIPKEDFVFKVAEICEELDYTELFQTYLRTWRKTNPITQLVFLRTISKLIRFDNVDKRTSKPSSKPSTKNRRQG